MPSLRYVLPFGNRMLPRLASLTMFIQLSLILFNIYEVLKPTVISILKTLMKWVFECCSCTRAAQSYEKASIIVGMVSE